MVVDLLEGSNLERVASLDARIGQEVVHSFPYQHAFFSHSRHLYLKTTSKQNNIEGDELLHNDVLTTSSVSVGVWAPRFAITRSPKPPCCGLGCGGGLWSPSQFDSCLELSCEVLPRPLCLVELISRWYWFGKDCIDGRE